MSQGIERIADSLGYLVLNEDGAVISVSNQNHLSHLHQPPDKL